MPKVKPKPDAYASKDLEARSIFHCFDHGKFNERCPGCQAKIRNRKHFKGAFERNSMEYEHTVTMDQVSLTDLDGTLGHGRWRYALVICKISTDWWTFMLMRTLESDETQKVFREFMMGLPNEDLASVVVYCDAHQSLIKVCNDMKLSRRHPPPGHPQANAVIERKIGVALEGLRAYLVTGCLPNCFWPYAGHCYSFNSCLKVKKGMEQSPYEALYGLFEHRAFIFGQLVLLKPAKTILKRAKTDNPLMPGIFLDYYVGPGGRFTGQYLVCELEDFSGTCLHH